MKRMMAWVCAMAVLGAACFCGCASKVPYSSSARASSATKAADGDDSDAAEILIRQDADDLVQVRIEGGQASIRLNPERWEERYGAEFSEAGQMFGDMEIVDFSDPSFFAPVERTEHVPIKDACIGTVPGFSDWSMYSFPIPVAMLLREDGRVEAVFADPFATRYTSEGMLLAFLEDVTSLSVGISSGDGRGDPSMYATCADGLRYDLQYLFSHTVSQVFGVNWSCTLGGSPWQTTVQLQLFEEGAAQLTLLDGSRAIAEYVGSHAFVLAEGQDYYPPTLVLDLALEACDDPAIQARGDIHGAYFYELGVQDSFLQLWLSFGDALFADEGGAPVTEYWLSGYGEESAGDGAALPAGFGTLFDGDWVAELEPATNDFDGYQGILRFAEEARVEFYIVSGATTIDTYGGSYSIVPAGDDPGAYRMVFDLALDWTMAEGGEGADDEAFPRYEIQGSYRAEMADGVGLHLWLSDGDALYNNQFGDQNGPKAEYSFTLVPYAVG